MMFVARYRDGSCGIAEASDEASAQALLESDEAYFRDHDKIVSLRPLSRPFVTRWYFDSRGSDELPEIDRLDGMLSHSVPKADVSTPLIYNERQLDQMEKWEKNLKYRLRQAVELELERFKQ
jgi:hypothetical protein